MVARIRRPLSAKHALRDLERLLRSAAAHGAHVGTYAERLLDDRLPWTRMRQVYRLLVLAKRYGSEPVDTACGRALELDVLSAGKIASMLERATENAPTPPRAAEAAQPARFARAASEYQRPRPDWMAVLDGRKERTHS